MKTISEELVCQLVRRDVDTVFGIPGVHTVELYRGLAESGIHHVTPRHEQGAGFMADGYARVSGKPGVAFVITGPGVTNTLTAMGQARADSVPMLVISGVNALSTLGKGMGHLHELPDQRDMVATVALLSLRIESAVDLLPALDMAFSIFASQRPGPVHIEIPLDVAGLPFDATSGAATLTQLPSCDPQSIAKAVTMLESSSCPVIVVGGGARYEGVQIRALAEKISAPVIQTVNARGLMFQHPLSVPASPSLLAIHPCIESADTVLVVGSELGATDFDMNETGKRAAMRNLIRIDICQQQLDRHPAEIKLCSDARSALQSLNSALHRSANNGTGEARAEQARQLAFAELTPDMQLQNQILNAARDSMPNSIMVGDSAQPIYAGNYCYDHDRPGAWFNAATGFGALGYAIPAAVGASIAQKDARVICIVGDGGAQFSLPEIMAAKDEQLPIVFLVWNNFGYMEIDTWMRNANVTAVGCNPTPPDFKAVAESCGIPHRLCAAEPQALAQALCSLNTLDGPSLVEIRT